MTRQKCACYPRPPRRDGTSRMISMPALVFFLSLRAQGGIRSDQGPCGESLLVSTICESLPRGPNTIGAHLGLSDRLERWWFVPLFPQW